MYELGIPSEDVVNDMPWREFQLKRYGYMRQQKVYNNQVGVIAYMIYQSIPEKEKKKSFNQWWSSEANNGIKDWQKQQLLEAQKKAIEEAKQKKLKNG